MKLKVCSLVVAFATFTACGFSAYENYLLSGRQTHVMLFSAAKDGQAGALQAALKTMSGAQAAQAFERVKISNPYERWVKQTDPCQKPLPDADGIWSAMEEVSE
jgi:L-rhamnose mutarotase